jgi:16S rRNA (cytidine1402-2'-O)-methyltransferase
MKFGTLFVVATPIGNLSDITFRAIETLKSVDIILAEDTRVTSKLLNHYDIDTDTLSYHQHSSDNKKLKILNFLNQGKNLALVTDAGTPGISDPGPELINFIYTNNPQIRFIPIPGPSSLTAAASISGFNMSHFLFIGYFPKKQKTRILKLITDATFPVVYLDSPHRLQKNLKLLLDNIGDLDILIARELTKIHEELFRGEISQSFDWLKNSLKGEVIVIVNAHS